MHREEPPPHILDDFCASTLAGPEGAAIQEQLLAELPQESLLAFNRSVCVRARYPEDVLDRALGKGASQYVVLGAGLDSFAYRRADMAGRVRVFEVDHPHMQAWKRQRLADAGLKPVVDLTFVPVDFERQTLATQLEQAGFDFSQPAVVSWVGVTMYLTVDAIRETLLTVARGAAGTTMVLTYNQPQTALTGLGAQTQSALSDIEHFGPSEALAAYFPGRNDVKMAGAQRLITGTVRARPSAV